MFDNIDLYAEEVLTVVLRGLDLDRGILDSDRAPKNVAARWKIYALMRACEHPDCRQLSLRRIARVCKTDATAVRQKIKKYGELPSWKFNEHRETTFNIGGSNV